MSPLSLPLPLPLPTSTSSFNLFPHFLLCLCHVLLDAKQVPSAPLFAQNGKNNFAFFLLFIFSFLFCCCFRNAIGFHWRGLTWLHRVGFWVCAKCRLQAVDINLINSHKQACIIYLYCCLELHPIYGQCINLNYHMAYGSLAIELIPYMESVSREGFKRLLQESVSFGNSWKASSRS